MFAKGRNKYPATWFADDPDVVSTQERAQFDALAWGIAWRRGRRIYSKAVLSRPLKNTLRSSDRTPEQLATARQYLRVLGDYLDELDDHARNLLLENYHPPLSPADRSRKSRLQAKLVEKLKDKLGGSGS